MSLPLLLLYIRWPATRVVLRHEVVHQDSVRSINFSAYPQHWCLFNGPFLAPSLFFICLARGSSSSGQLNGPEGELANVADGMGIILLQRKCKSSPAIISLIMCSRFEMKRKRGTIENNTKMEKELRKCMNVCYFTNKLPKIAMISIKI